METTGTTGPDDPLPDEIVEIGWCDVDSEACTLRARRSMLVDPRRPVTPQARGVHHIADAELVGAVDRKQAIIAMATNGGERVADAFAAHEARHERSLWSTSRRPWLCTRKAALRVWPDAPDHKLQTLRYWLDLQCDRDQAWPPHRAGPDAYVGAVLLLKLLEHANVEQMIEWTVVPSLLPVCHLKKHKGKRWEDVPEDYLDWMLKQPDIDEDLTFTARHHKDLRRPKRDW